MAKKASSRAEQIVSGERKKVPSKGKQAAPAKTGKKPTKKHPATVNTEYENPISNGVILGLMSLCLFVLFFVISINPEGALLKLVQSIILGLFGPAGFYIAIPGFFYLFVINIFTGKRSMRGRSIATAFFMLLCGMFYHLLRQKTELPFELEIFGRLFEGGKTGFTGGFVCGFLAECLRWSCGKVLAFVLCSIAAVFSLLAAVGITPASLLRAIANRPRDLWEEEEYVEPATKVVNHIANKQIAHKRQKREQARLNVDIPLDAEKPQSDEKGKKSPKSSFMDRIEEDPAAPISGNFHPTKVQEELPDVEIEMPIPAAKTIVSVSAPMPELNKHQVNAAPPKPLTPPMETENPQKVTAKDTARAASEITKQIAKTAATSGAEYEFPPIDLLNRPGRAGNDGTDEMRENSRRLNETLASFNIDAHIIDVTRGPSVTRYEVELDKGVRLNKITGCADDIALSLGASGVRIAAVPGKISVVGIEVPNRTVTTVSLREVIDSAEFHNAKSHTAISLGKSIDGHSVVGNIAKMPHLLIAGTTGSGKSVCMNSIIISLLYKSSPEDVKLIMVDPKMVELGIYNGIPHLLIPVVTDPKKAAGSLQWAVTEMLRRYKLMSDMGVRDLESYNSIVVGEEDGQKLPTVVIIIDELADLMMVAAKEVEDSICRIAQMGRAAGMHLIIATQRPSANVITGLMKANIPSRIAFSVASAMESRIILDTMGAEKLVGKGDMLYAPIGSGKPLRVQGCFVTDGEVEKVAEFVKENNDAQYDSQVQKDVDKNSSLTSKKPATVADPDPTEDELEGDEMLPAAVEVILETKQASVSMLQRRLKLGYARAARIVDEMEEKGYVGPFQGSKPREIRITKEQWEAKKQGKQDSFFDDESLNEVPEEID